MLESNHSTPDEYHHARLRPFACILFMKKFLRLLPFLLLAACGKTGAPTAPTIPDAPVQLQPDGDVDPIADSHAVHGGTFSSWPGPFPKSVNEWLEYDSFPVEISNLMYEPLLELHSTQDVPIGDLAQSWEISPDKQTFTFHLNPAAKWSDGTPVTAQDVQFYYDVIMNPKNQTPVFRVDLQNLNRPEVIDDHTLRVTVNKVHWKNFWIAGTELYAFPRQAWANVDFNTLNLKVSDFSVVDGPYMLDNVDINQSIRLKRRGDWWGRVQKYNQYKYNFDYLVFKSTEDRQAALESLKRGDYDEYFIYTAKIWAEDTNFPQVQKNWVIRQNIHNQHPVAFQGFALNMSRPLFQDIRVRQALAYLLDRKLMNEKLMFNEYFLLNSYFPDLYPNDVNPDIPATPYDPDKARELLKEAGWQVGPDGILEKDGQQLNISIPFFESDMRHVNIYIEDMKKVGINAHIDMMDLATWTTHTDHHQFDMAWVNFDAVRLRDPEPLWSSKTANDIAGQNYAALQDAEVDKLIDQQRTEMDLDKRNEIDKQIDARLMALCPYVLMWQSASYRVLYWNRFGTPKSVLSKYSDNGVGGGVEYDPFVYWWYDAAKAAALDDAIKRDVALPAQPAEVHYGQ